MSDVADAIRTVTSKMQTAIDAGHASRVIDAGDLIEALLAIACKLDPEHEFSETEIDPQSACSDCGERRAKHLGRDDSGAFVRCRTCETIFEPGSPGQQPR